MGALPCGCVDSDSCSRVDKECDIDDDDRPGSSKEVQEVCRVEVPKRDVERVSQDLGAIECYVTNTHLISFDRDPEPLQEHFQYLVCTEKGRKSWVNRPCVITTDHLKWYESGGDGVELGSVQIPVIVACRLSKCHRVLTVQTYSGRCLHFRHQTPGVAGTWMDSLLRIKPDAAALEAAKNAAQAMEDEATRRNKLDAAALEVEERAAEVARLQAEEEAARAEVEAALLKSMPSVTSIAGSEAEETACDDAGRSKLDRRHTTPASSFDLPKEVFRALPVAQQTKFAKLVKMPLGSERNRLLDEWMANMMLQKNWTTDELDALFRRKPHVVTHIFDSKKELSVAERVALTEQHMKKKMVKANSFEL